MNRFILAVICSICLLASAGTCSAGEVLGAFGLEPAAFSADAYTTLPIRIGAGSDMGLLVQTDRLQAGEDSFLMPSGTWGVVLLVPEGPDRWRRAWTWDGDGVSNLRVLDVDRDGREDLLGVSRDAARDWNVLCWFRQTESGGFAGPARAELGDGIDAEWVDRFDEQGRILVCGWRRGGESGANSERVVVILSCVGDSLHRERIVPFPQGPIYPLASLDACVPGDSSGTLILEWEDPPEGYGTVCLRLGESGWEGSWQFPFPYAERQDFMALRRDGRDEIWYWPGADTLYNLRPGSNDSPIASRAVPIEGWSAGWRQGQSFGPPEIAVLHEPTLLARTCRNGNEFEMALVEITPEGNARKRLQWGGSPATSSWAFPSALARTDHGGPSSSVKDEDLRIVWSFDGAMASLPLRSRPVPPPDLAFDARDYIEIYRGSSIPRSPLCDLTGDGRPDLLYVQNSVGDYRLALRLGIDRSPWFGPRAEVEGLPTSAEDFTSADLDGDGCRDLLVHTRESETNDVLQPAFWNGATLKAEPASRVVLPPWSNVLAGDFDGDGKDEILCTSDSTGRFFSWGRDRLPAPTVPITAVIPWGIVGAADVDGDGREELLNFYRTAMNWRKADCRSGVFGRAESASSAVGLYGGTVLQLLPDPPVEICWHDDRDVRIFRLGGSPEDRGRTLALPPIRSATILQAADLEADGARDLVFKTIGSRPTSVPILRDPWGEAAVEIGFLPEVLSGFGPFLGLRAYWFDLDRDGADDLVLLRGDGVRVVRNPVLDAAAPRFSRVEEKPVLRLLSSSPGSVPISAAVRVSRPGPLLLTLIDPGGRQVWSEHLETGMPGWTQVRIEPGRGASLASGTYFLRAKSAQGESATKVVILH